MPVCTTSFSDARVPDAVLKEAKRLNARVRRGSDYRLDDMRTRGARYVLAECEKAAREGEPWRPDFALEIAPGEVPFMALLSRAR